jgi:transcriptional regulator with XRE-family HTH domain
MRPRSLGELIAARRRELELSLRQVDERTASHGCRVSYSTLHDIETQQRNTLSDPMLVSIAAALNMPLAQLRQAAGKTPRQPPPFQLPARAVELNARERRAVLAVVDALLAAKDSR